MAFLFRLAAVLRMRIIIEEREEGILQKILFDIAKVLDDLQRIDAKIEECEALRHAGALESCLGLDLQASYGEATLLKDNREKLKLQLHTLEAARDAQAIVYESARRDREMLSEMREEKRVAYEAEAAKREQSIQDDNYIARRGRF